MRSFIAGVLEEYDLIESEENMAVVLGMFHKSKLTEQHLNASIIAYGFPSIPHNRLYFLQSFNEEHRILGCVVLDEKEKNFQYITYDLTKLTPVVTRIAKPQREWIDGERIIKTMITTSISFLNAPFMIEFHYNPYENDGLTRLVALL